MEIIGLILAGIVMAYAYWLYKMGADILDIDSYFNTAVFTFFILFIVVAGAMAVIVPDPAKKANLGGLVRTWMNPVIASEQQLPMY
ncbi:hypothetical protein IT407_03170 [Candidatus Uhrbacteria bacterium]|nr:hypothetical protein [Candidatus Uhrbacteria bacterium]